MPTRLRGAAAPTALLIHAWILLAICEGLVVGASAAPGGSLESCATGDPGYFKSNCSFVACPAAPFSFAFNLSRIDLEQRAASDFFVGDLQVGISWRKHCLLLLARTAPATDDCPRPAVSCRLRRPMHLDSQPCAKQSSEWDLLPSGF